MLKSLGSMSFLVLLILLDQRFVICLSKKVSSNKLYLTMELSKSDLWEVIRIIVYISTKMKFCIRRWVGMLIQNPEKLERNPLLKKQYPRLVMLEN